MLEDIRGTAGSTSTSRAQMQSRLFVKPCPYHHIATKATNAATHAVFILVYVFKCHPKIADDVIVGEAPVGH